MIGVVAHDAGGAEVLSAYLVACPIENVKYYLKGPSVKIFKNQKLIGKEYLYKDLDYKYIDYFIISMSWGNEFTFEVLKRSKILGIKTQLILDSWYDYSKRFGYPDASWTSILPSEIIVVDSIAERIVFKQGIDKYCKIRKINNYYLQNLKNQYQALNVDENRCFEVLLLSTPIVEAKSSGLKEFQDTNTTMIDILKDVASICNKNNKTLRIRMHPSQNKKTLKKFYELLGLGFVISENTSLIEDLRYAKHVVGFDSLALIQSSVLGKESISFQKNDLKDLFGWSEYGVYSYFKIKKVNNLSMLEKIISEE